MSTPRGSPIDCINISNNSSNSNFLKSSILKNSNQINVELLGEILIVILGLNTVQT